MDILIIIFSILKKSDLYLGPLGIPSRLILLEIKRVTRYLQLFIRVCEPVDSEVYDDGFSRFELGTRCSTAYLNSL